MALKNGKWLGKIKSGSSQLFIRFGGEIDVEVRDCAKQLKFRRKYFEFGGQGKRSDEGELEV